MLRSSWPRFWLNHRRKDEENCLHASQHALCITFTHDDMQVKGKHDRPLYFTRYIGSSEVSRIQVDPGSALSIMPHRVMQHLRILNHQLSATQTIIYGFNANGTRPMGKIKLKCQIEDKRSELTCYVIDADTSYICCWDDHGFIVTPYPLYSPSNHEVCWRRWKSLNVDRRKASVQGGGELLHGLPLVLGFFRDIRESSARGTRLW